MSNITLFHLAIPLVLQGGLLVALMMFGLWLVHLRIRNAGVVDIGWSIGLAMLALLYAIRGPGDSTRKWLIAGMVTIWGVRLAWHIFRRTIGHPEEGRYQQLRKEWKSNIPAKFLAFFEFQAILDAVLSLPFLLAALNPDPRISILEWLGTGVWLIAVVGESIADAQLTAFKRNTANHGLVCQVGLWNYSRHPNYFFEWLVWIGWALFALTSPYGWLALICPILMFYFLFRLTGIPATEAQALRSKGEAYRRYQQSTSAFIPWFKKLQMQ